MANEKVRMTRTYLDEIEAGTDETMEQERTKSRADKKKLPEGCKESFLYRDVTRIAWPTLLESVLTSLSSMVDMMMVGTLGTSAIAAVGLAAQPRFLINTLVMSFNTGATAVVARARGAQDHERANFILKQALFFNFLLAVVSSAIGFFFSEELVYFMSAGAMAESTVQMGVQYLQIQFIGFITMGITMTITANLRGSGNSRVPMVYNMVANVVNVIGNYCLIGGHFGFPALGVAGASIATVFGQFVAMIMAIIAVTNGKNYFHIKLFEKGFKFDFGVIKSIANVGIPALFEQLIMRVGVIIFARTVATLSELAYATHQICMNIQSLTMMVGMAFGTSATALVGQSLGKKRADMAEHYSRCCRRIGFVFSLLLMVIFGVFGKTIVGFYTDDAEVIRLGGMVMLALAATQPVQTSQFVVSGALRGAGDTKATAVISFLTALICRPVLGIVFVTVMGLGLSGAWGAIIADQLFRTGLVLYRYNSGKWKRIRVDIR